MYDNVAQAPFAEGFDVRGAGNVYKKIATKITQMALSKAKSA
jgi:hypothetical protein